MPTLSDIFKKRKQPQEGRVVRIRRGLKQEVETPQAISEKIIADMRELNSAIIQYAEELKKKDNDDEYEIVLTPEILETIRGEKGESVKGDKGEQGIAGKDGVNGRDGIDGKDGKPGKDGKNGKDGRNGVDGKNGKDGKNGENGKKPRHQISNGAIRFENQDGTWGEWLRIRQERSFGGGGDVIETEDLSSQCDSATKTFPVTYNISKIISLSSTQFPIIYRPTVDYTFSGKTITLTSEVGAPQTGQTLVVIYVR